MGARRALNATRVPLRATTTPRAAMKKPAAASRGGLMQRRPARAGRALRNDQNEWRRPSANSLMLFDVAVVRLEIDEL